MSLSEGKLRIRSEIFDCEPTLDLKLGQGKPKTSGTVPTNRHIKIPSDSGPVSESFEDDPKLLDCEVAQSGPATSLRMKSPTPAMT